jgi:hypothetical protein
MWSYDERQDKAVTSVFSFNTLSLPRWLVDADGNGDGNLDRQLQRHAEAPR